MNRVTAVQLIAELGLLRHPEGGWYRETYRSAETIAGAVLPPRFNGSRPFCTAIYFLLEPGDFSALHRINSDELWHFYAGSGLIVHVINLAGEHQELRLGADITAGESFQAMVPAGCWFGAEPSKEDGYCLAGCTVAPGFDFADFAMGDRTTLLEQFPQHAALIQRLTRNSA